MGLVTLRVGGGVRGAWLGQHNEPHWGSGNRQSEQRTITPRRHAVAELAETLRYKPEDRGFDSQWCHCNFSLT